MAVLEKFWTCVLFKTRAGSIPNFYIKKIGLGSDRNQSTRIHTHTIMQTLSLCEHQFSSHKVFFSAVSILK